MCKKKSGCDDACAMVNLIRHTDNADEEDVSTRSPALAVTTPCETEALSSASEDNTVATTSACCNGGSNHYGKNDAVA